MVPLIKTFEAVLENVGVDFCGGNVSMSKHGLNGSKICSLSAGDESRMNAAKDEGVAESKFAPSFRTLE